MVQRNVTDVETLRAVTHPTRSKMLGLLRYDGPATASQLARRLGESSGSTSYHLRQLARFGFVEEDPEQPNRRDRRWRATHRMTSWSRAAFAADPAGREISEAMERRQVLAAVETWQRWYAVRDGIDPRWQEAAGIYDYLLRLTPSQLAALVEELAAVFTRFADDPPPPADAAEPVGHVRVHGQLLPFTEVPL
ncbi:MAG TPA: helix-turn-helix domain-containing protein [Pilimelia sp.]|nr:helix-turn-helix domain-containing protein [Pilimelia sp.]